MAARLSHSALGALLAMSAAMLSCGCSTAHLVNNNRDLMEPQSMPFLKSYETVGASRTTSVPVAFDAPDESLSSVVIRDTVGMPTIDGRFSSGKIVAREFQKFFDANFRRPTGDEKPVATFSVQPGMMTLKRSLFSSEVTCNLRMTVVLTRLDGGDVGYSHDFSVSRTSSWDSGAYVPSAFYEALVDVVGSLLRGDVAEVGWQGGRWREAA